jgi:hypothetical protein
VLHSTASWRLNGMACVTTRVRSSPSSAPRLGRNVTSKSPVSLPDPVLRRTVSRPNCLGIKHPSRTYDQSESDLYYDRWSVGQSVLVSSPHLGLMTRFLLLSDHSGVCSCGALSLTRGWVCHLLLILALASAVIFGSESRGTRDHILLSQIRDFLIRRLLRLEGPRWRHSTPPPHGRLTNQIRVLLYLGANRK